VRALLELAVSAGAEVMPERAVAGIDPAGDGVQLLLADGSALRARCVVVAAGAWAGSLLAGLVELPPLLVTQQQVLHFPRLDAHAPPWPSVIHDDGRPVYHLAGGGARDHRKLGEHLTRAAPTTPQTRSYDVDAAARARAVEYVRRWLPGLDPAPLDETTCLYTTTPSEDFVLDRVGPIVVCSACSGHGAKFAPLIGEQVASLVLGEGVSVPDRFRLGAHLGARRGGVSL
jgi:sarcosine oxidase